MTPPKTPRFDYLQQAEPAGQAQTSEQAEQVTPAELAQQEQQSQQQGAVFTVWAVVQRLIIEAEHLEDGDIESALHELLEAFEHPAPAAPQPPLSLSLN